MKVDAVDAEELRKTVEFLSIIDGTSNEQMRDMLSAVAVKIMIEQTQAWFSALMARSGGGLSVYEKQAIADLQFMLALQLKAFPEYSHVVSVEKGGH